MNTKIDISKNMATQNSNFPILAVSNRHLAAHPFLACGSSTIFCSDCGGVTGTPRGSDPAGKRSAGRGLQNPCHKGFAHLPTIQCFLHPAYILAGCACPWMYLHPPAAAAASQPCRCRWNRLGKTGRFFRHRHLRPLRGRSAGSRKARRNVRCRRAHLCDRLQKRTCTPRSEVPSDCVQVRIAAGLWHRRY